ncbi:hypothetical protein ACJX0J_029534, partial [Zea mays]
KHTERWIGLPFQAILRRIVPIPYFPLEEQDSIPPYHKNPQSTEQATRSNIIIYIIMFDTFLGKSHFSLVPH